MEFIAQFNTLNLYLKSEITWATRNETLKYMGNSATVLSPIIA